MVVKTNMTVGGVEVTDYKDLMVELTQGEYNKSSNFRAILDSPYGRHSGSYTVGDEVVIKADENASPTTTIFTGILEQKQFRGVGNRQELVLRGRDYSARLQDVTVEPSVYSNSEVSTIVTDIINNYVQDITTTNVNVTSTTLKRIGFNQESVFEALQTLSDLSGFIFYIDETKDLHFEEANLTDSGHTFDSTNTITSVFDKTREKMANRVWVYGDRYLSGYKELLSVDGGSDYTLLYKPHDTNVDYLGSSLIGGIYQVAQAQSGPNYLVNFYDKQIIFQSGTDIGYNSIPTSGGSVVVTYNRELPIVKYGQDNASISQYGPKTKIIVDKTIKDPQTAIDILKKELEDSEPQKRMEFDLKGWFDFKVGQTAKLSIGDFGLSENNVGILAIEYKFNADSIQSGRIITVRLNEKVNDLIDELTDMRRRLAAIESQEVDSADVITRLETGVGSALVVGSYWEVRTISIAGNNLIYNSPTFGILGSATGNGEWAGSLVTSFVLGKNLSAILGTSTLGNINSTPVIITSGGYSYS